LFGAVAQQVALPREFTGDVLEAMFKVARSEDLAPGHHIEYEVQQLVRSLQQDANFDRTRLAGIEWGLLPFLDSETSEAGPDTLVGEVEARPAFFVQLLTMVHRAENEPRRETPLPEQELLQARHARTLLDALARLPGTQESGVIDSGYLRHWVEEVRSTAAGCGRLAICDETLGNLFARACKRSDGNWPPFEVAALMEGAGSEELFQGFTAGVITSRGVTSRGPWEGGDQERLLAERYRELARYARPHSPKLADAFLGLAAHQDAVARREDEDAERSKVGR
jgi:hypothetical protein